MHDVFPARHVGGAGELPKPLARDEHTRAFLASIVESSDDSIIGTDLEGTILSWNHGAERLWGYTAQEAIGAHIAMLFPGSHQLDYVRTLTSIQDDERIERFSSVRVRKDGMPQDVSVILSPIKDDDGRVRGVTAIYRDIGKDKQAEAELLKAKEAAEAASRAKSEFLANMSHEIRTPMNGILGMLDVALDMELSAELRDYLETARTSAGSLLVILNDILDFSKIEAGRMELEQTPLSVAAVVHETVSSLAVVARNKGLNLRYDLGPRIPMVLLGDPTRLRQVLVNLITNAVKFTQDGSVDIRAAVDRMDAEDALVRFSVTDTGIGMSGSQQEVIFPAHSSKPTESTTRRYGGTGLGLSISHRLVALMNGDLWVESEPGKGSAFHFTARLKRPLDLEAILRY